MSDNQKRQQTPSMEKNLEFLSKLYSAAFEYFRKNAPKKDQNIQKIKDCCAALKSPSTNFSSYEQIKYYSLIISQPFNTYDNSKIPEKIVTTIEALISRKLIDNHLLQEMIQKFLSHVYRASIFNEENFNYQMLSLCSSVYISDLNIHKEYLRYIFKIYLSIFLPQKNEQCTKTVKASFTQIIDYMMKKISLEEDKNNDANRLSKLYLNFFADVIEIANKTNSDIVIKYANSFNDENVDLQKDIENLNLSELVNEKGLPLGKYGWCFNCRGQCNTFNRNFNLPLCCVECENELGKIYSLIDNEYMYRSDYITILSYLAKISTAEGKEKKGGGEPLHSKCHEFCLEEITELLEKGNKYFQNDPRVIQIIKEQLIDSLVKNTLSNEITNLKLSIKLFLLIIKNFREHLKDQIDIFFNKVLLVILESENLSFEYKEVILDALLSICDDDVKLLVEIYVNYDCNVNYKAVFYELINLLTKIINGLYKRPKYGNLFKPIQEKTLKLKCLDFLTKFISKLGDIVEKEEKMVENSNPNQKQDQNESVFENEVSDNLLTASTINSSESMSFFGELKDKINQTLKAKALLSKAIDKFNIHSPSNCLSFLKAQHMLLNEATFNSFKTKYLSQQNNARTSLRNSIEGTGVGLSLNDEAEEQVNIMTLPFITNINPLYYFFQSLETEDAEKTTYEDFTAFEMSRFIRTNIKDLVRDKIGDYLCGGKDFNKKVVEFFIDSFDFKGLHILEALRVLFIELPLVGEGQVIDRIVSIFGKKYYKENPTILGNADLCYYLAFSIIMLNTDLHREEVEKKMTLSEYVQRLMSMVPPGENIPDGYLEDVFNRVQNNPLIIPGQKISSKKNKQELIQLEKEKILQSTVAQLRQSVQGARNYVTKIDNGDIRNLLDGSWSNFLGIFSQLLADFDDEKIVITCVSNILKMAGTCLILNLDTISEAFINTIINATNLSDGREILPKNFECIIGLIDFVLNYGQYIRTCWYNILLVISKIDFYSSLGRDIETFKKEIKAKSKSKNIEKELEIEEKNMDIIKKGNLEMKIDSIFSKTYMFKEEPVINFVDSLCKVSLFELTKYSSPRVYSLHKLVEVADFNLFRIQIEWVSIWKKISNHLIHIISNSLQENIWREALDSLKQTICKLLQKPDQAVYGFQKDYLKPFAVIFSQTVNSPERGEIILNYIEFIVGTYTKLIHSGWTIIFDILKEGLLRQNKQMNDYIKKILLKISDDCALFNEPSQEVFTGYVECLCYMYLDKNFKQFAFDTILSLFSKITKAIINSEKEDKKKKEKKYDFFKIFFYGFDDLIRTNPIEHLNLLCEVIMYNKEIFFGNDIYSFVYSYYSYFKPHLAIFMMYFCEYYAKLFDGEDVLRDGKANDDIFNNLKHFLEVGVEDQIEIIKKGEASFVEIKSDEEKTKMINLLKLIKKNYGKDSELVLKKFKIIESLNEKNFEIALDFFIEKMEAMLTAFAKENKDNQTINYTYFYEDLLLSTLKLSLYNKYPKIIFGILIKNISRKDLSESFYVKLTEKNIQITTALANAKTKLTVENINSLLLFASGYMKYFTTIIEKKSPNDKTKLYKTLSLIENKFLLLDIENTNKDFSLMTSKESIEIISAVQEAKKLLLSSEVEDYYDSSNFECLVNFDKIFQKYTLNTKEESEVFTLIQFELDYLLPKFLIYLNEKELEFVFNSLIGFIDSINVALRTSSKNLLRRFVSEGLCVFKPHK